MAEMKSIPLEEHTYLCEAGQSTVYKTWASISKSATVYKIHSTWGKTVVTRHAPNNHRSYNKVYESDEYIDCKARAMCLFDEIMRQYGD